MKLVYYLVIAKSLGRDYKYFKPKIIIIIIYTREIAPESLRPNEWKFQERIKSNIERKKERNSSKRGMH